MIFWNEDDYGMQNFEMTVKNRTKLNYSSEFRIACKINNITKEEIIQYLIDHVSFYAFIGGDMGTAYLWATTVAVECKDFLNSPMQNESDSRIKEISLKYIKKLTNLSMSSKFRRQEESEKSLQLMKTGQSKCSRLQTTILR